MNQKVINKSAYLSQDKFEKIREYTQDFLSSELAAHDLIIVRKIIERFSNIYANEIGIDIDGEERIYFGTKIKSIAKKIAKLKQLDRVLYLSLKDVKEKIILQYKIISQYLHDNNMKIDEESILMIFSQTMNYIEKWIFITEKSADTVIFTTWKKIEKQAEQERLLEETPLTQSNVNVSFDDSWKRKIVASINKQAFLTIVNGENKFSTYESVAERLFRNRSNDDVDKILEMYKLNQNIIDKVFNKIKISIPPDANQFGEFYYKMPSNLSSFISFNTNVRVDEGLTNTLHSYC